MGGTMERADVLDTRAVGAKAAAEPARRARAARYFMVVGGGYQRVWFKRKASVAVHMRVHY